MAKGTVLIYQSELGLPLRAHQKALLTADAKALATVKQYDFGGQYDVTKNYARPVYFIPDDTLLVDEAQSLGIQGPSDLYGGVVPHPFVKTKAITHPLVDTSAERPPGWSFGFAERINDIVTYGLVLEENLHRVRTLSIGHITVDSVSFTYHGTQRVTMDNDEQPAYGDRKSVV